MRGTPGWTIACLALLLPLITTPLRAAEPKNERLRWFNEARYGMFIHWGLYAVPAGEWNGVTKYDEWIQLEAKIPCTEYDKLAGKFNPQKFDAKAWARFCTADAQLVTVRGESMNGVSEIEKGLATVFETRARRAALKTLDISIRFIRPDVALAHVTNELSGLVSPEGQPLPSHRELSIRVLVKDQGAWRITAFHNTMLQR